MKIARHWTKASYTGTNIAQKELSCSVWERRYDETTREYRVCELVEEWGDAVADGEISAVREKHDSLACGGEGRFA